MLKYIASRLAERYSVSMDGAFQPIDAADEFGKIVNQISEKCDGRRITLILDEIEWIAPRTAVDRHWDQDYIAFWHAVRSYQTDSRKLNFIVAGVNPFVVELDTVNNHQNPLFGIVT